MIFYHAFSANNSGETRITVLETTEDRGQTDRVTALPRPHALDSAAVASFGSATLHASPRWRAADDVTTAVSRYSTLALTHDLHDGL